MRCAELVGPGAKRGEPNWQHSLSSLTEAKKGCANLATHDGVRRCLQREGGVKPTSSLRLCATGVTEGPTKARRRRCRVSGRGAAPRFRLLTHPPTRLLRPAIASLCALRLQPRHGCSRPSYARASARSRSITPHFDTAPRPIHRGAGVQYARQKGGTLQYDRDQLEYGGRSRWLSSLANRIWGYGFAASVRPGA